jgi:hypothetical protein
MSHQKFAGRDWSDGVEDAGGGGVLSCLVPLHSVFHKLGSATKVRAENG